MTEALGAQQGSGERILLTHCHGDNPVEVELLGDTGSDMRKGLRETIRCWEQNRRREFVGRGILQLSFEDKSHPVDGMSAGAAFAVLLHSYSDGFDIDPRFCMTGDLSVQGRILDVGSVYEKLGGGAAAGCTRAAVPLASESELLDGVVLNGPELLATIEVLGVETLSDAIGVARIDRSRSAEAATAAFVSLRGPVQERIRSGATAPNARLRNVTREILTVFPNHLSAKIVGKWNEGILPKLSIGSSIAAQDRVLDSYLRKIRTGSTNDLADLDHEDKTEFIQQARRSLQVLRSKLDPATTRIGREMEELFGDAVRFVEFKQRIEEAEKAISSQEERIESLKARIARLSANGAPRQDVSAFIKNHNCQVEELAKRAARRDALEKERQAAYNSVVVHHNAWLKQVRSLELDPKLRDRVTTGK